MNLKIEKPTTGVCCESFIYTYEKKGVNGLHGYINKFWGVCKMRNLINSKLSFEEEKAFKKRIKIRMIEDDLTYADLSIRTGYSVRAIENAVCQSGTMTKFLTSALADTLNIDLNEIRRRESNG